MRMIGWMSDKTGKDRIRNQNNRDNLGVVTLEDKMKENNLRQFSHVYKRLEQVLIRRKDGIQKTTERRRG